MVETLKTAQAATTAARIDGTIAPGTFPYPCPELPTTGASWEECVRASSRYSVNLRVCQKIGCACVARRCGECVDEYNSGTRDRNDIRPVRPGISLCEAHADRAVSRWHKPAPRGWRPAPSLGQEQLPSSIASVAPKAPETPKPVDPPRVERDEHGTVVAHPDVLPSPVPVPAVSKVPSVKREEVEGVELNKTTAAMYIRYYLEAQRAQKPSHARLLDAFNLLYEGYAKDLDRIADAVNHASHNTPIVLRRLEWMRRIQPEGIALLKRAEAAGRKISLEWLYDVSRLAGAMQVLSIRQKAARLKISS